MKSRYAGLAVACAIQIALTGLPASGRTAAAPAGAGALDHRVQGLPESNAPGMRAFCDPARSEKAQPRQPALAKAAAPLNIADLNRLSNAQVVSAIAAFTGSANGLSNFFAFNADSKAFYGDSDRVLALIDAVTQRAATVTATDARGIVPLVEVIRAGFFLGFYNPDLGYLKNSRPFIKRLIPAQNALFANTSIGWQSAVHLEVLGALGSLLGIGTFGAEAIPGLTALAGGYLAHLTEYSGDDARTSTLYSLLSGFDYGLIEVHLYALEGDPGKSPWNGKIGELFASTAKLAVSLEMDADQRWFVNNASWWLCRWGRFVPRQTAIDALTKVIDTYGKVSIASLQSYQALADYHGGVDAHGDKIDMKAIKSDLTAQLLPTHMRFDSGTVIIKAGGLVSKDKLYTLYWTMKEVNAHAFRLMRRDAPLESGPDDSITMVIYNSPEEYEFNRILNGLATANGGMYIEGDGTFYTYERTPQQSIYSLEELFRHEFVHYVASRHLIPGMYGQGLYANERLSWFDEGLAEFLAGSTREGGILVRRTKVKNLDLRNTMSVSEVTHAKYSSGWNFYDFSGVLFNYLYENRRDLLFTIFARIRNNDGPGFDKLMSDMGSDAALNTAYQAYLTAAVAKVSTLTVPSTSPLYLQLFLPKPLNEILADIRKTTGIAITDSKTYTSDRSSYFHAGGEYEVTGTDSLAAWKSMDEAANGFLKQLSALEWVGYQTVTAYFADPVATGGKTRYRVVFRGKIDNGTIAIRPALPGIRRGPLFSVPSLYSPGMEIKPAAEFPAGVTADQVRISVFDMQGTLVRLLTRDAAGLWRWDGSDASGRNAAAGRYFLRLAYGSDTEAKQLIFRRP